MDGLDSVWRNKTDDEVLLAAQSLDEYTESGQRAILKEFENRRERIAERHALYEVASGMIESHGDEVEGALVEMGLNPIEASSAVADVHSAATADARAKIQRGGLSVLLGILASLVLSAFGAQLGFAVVCWGLVAYGLILSIDGWSSLRHIERRLRVKR
ncbi:MAG: hypothetical protein GC160_12085 [Acidobacteria bacterium]|nr:hypothetical protein [Acidobacteriota bacterium]